MPASELVGVRIREALRQVILGWGRLGTPVVMVVEDSHWIDTASRSVLDDVVRNATDETLLLLCSFRPQFQPIPAVTPAASDLRLTALTNVVASEIIRERLEGKALPEELVRLGVTKSEGNPLFAEEFANYLSHKGAQLDSDDDAVFNRSGDLDDIPTSLENLIMDRVHRLGRDTISFLQAASVLGRQFPMSLAEQMADINGGMPQLLPQPRDGRSHLPGGFASATTRRPTTPSSTRWCRTRSMARSSPRSARACTEGEKAAEALEASY
jgi:hypothetical protein